MRTATLAGSSVVDRIRSAALWVERATGWVCKAAAWATRWASVWRFSSSDMTSVRISGFLRR